MIVNSGKCRQLLSSKFVYFTVEITYIPKLIWQNGLIYKLNLSQDIKTGFVYISKLNLRNILLIFSYVTENKKIISYPVTGCKVVEVEVADDAKVVMVWVLPTLLLLLLQRWWWWWCSCGGCWEAAEETKTADSVMSRKL